MDARQFSLRQLVMMRDGKEDSDYAALIARRNDDWDQTSHLLAAVCNMLAEKPKTPDQMNPTLPKGETDEDPAIRAEQDAVIAERRAMAEQAKKQQEQ